MKKLLTTILCFTLILVTSCVNNASDDKSIKVSNDFYYTYNESCKELLVSLEKKDGYMKSSFEELNNIYKKYNYDIETISFEKSENKFRPNTLKYAFGNIKLTTIKGFENIDTSYVEDFSHSFSCCNCITYEILDSLNTRSGKTFQNMFENCGSLYHFDCSKYDFSNAVCLDDMFNCCYNLEEVNLNDCDFGNVTSMDTMFSGCQSLKKVDFSDSDFSKCENINGLFADCTFLTNVFFDNASFNNVKYMSCMFVSCDYLETIDLSSFDLSNLIECVDTNGFGSYSDFIPSGFCTSSSKLEVIYLPKSFDASFIERDKFYEGCDSLEAIYYKDDNNIELIKTFKE